MRNPLAILVVLTCVATSAVCQSLSPATTSAFAEPALTGVKLSVAHGVRAGKVSENRGQCVAGLPSSTFSDVVARLLSQNLAPAELREAETFFASQVGKKFVQYGVLQIYESVGEPLPAPLPEFTAAEYKLLESFAATKAGDALIKQKVMESSSSRQALQLRIGELLSQCTN